ncbi:MAG: hypothetical protein JO056_06015 [Alphaproteobacteria bacterium]|nr:hypothetical protein [Alphaproteobacteria bacterium]
MATPDYFAELYVAGLFADAGWNVYFPHRDKGFDFIVSKANGDQQVIRPVQVKGKYPTPGKGDRAAYGYVGRLTVTHPQMVLAIPFFPSNWITAPACTAYLPMSIVRRASRGYRCFPATLRRGIPTPRRDFKKYFDKAGLAHLDDNRWGHPPN